PVVNKSGERRSAGRVAHSLEIATLAALAALAVIVPQPAWATTLTSVQFATDTPTLFGSQLVTPDEAATDDLAGNVGTVSLGTLPAGVHVTGFEVDQAQNRLLFSLDVPVVLGGALFTPRDVIGYASGAYSQVWNGAAAGVPEGTHIEGISVDSQGGLLLALDTPATLGSVAYDPRDVVLWKGGGFSLAFDGVASGLEPGLHVDGVHALVNGHLLLSFDGNGVVGGVAFFDDDVLELDPIGAAWSKVYDGQSAHQGWVAANLAALSAMPLPAVTAIPTLSAAGLALLAFFLLVTAWILARRAGTGHRSRHYRPIP
ncbi:MAG TPA: hypothetical protein VKA53_06940, partial [Thermoanaerobaculia bacterium]|nr:hypothetical protein [Thermoanaerobaculia bacterium]